MNDMIDQKIQDVEKSYNNNTPSNYYYDINVPT